MPTTSDSLYEHLFPLSTVMRQRFVDNFSGGTLNERWTESETGTGSGAMVDAVDGGYRITSGAVSGNKRILNFNNKRQYDSESCTFISVVTRVTSGVYTGLNDSLQTLDNASNEAGTLNKTGASFQTALTSDSTTQSETNTDVAPDTSTRVYSGAVDASDFQLSFDGVLKVTKTTNLPIAKIQPWLMVFEQSGTAGSADIRYMEVFNS